MSAWGVLTLETFEQDDRLRVAVLWGDNGTFCSGADLTAMVDPESRNVVDPEGKGPGPMGSTRMTLSKPVIAAISGYAVVPEESLAEAKRFSKGAGRHGEFDR